ncbi:uncharacterized protein P174DRAFT_437864 [Aspergillus novofumigatus IBT 16806]|uniref:Uncharacterized protein n=1 Tax=Aspergillus novofumigatus (strain IBT 16806) TaxID=1392255 RepID=A0A2I1CP70_ASPN1|nr:uncharacterized protein P174DRAFT_437864 [Aspergillus novofumigatus IBT 16806]PKX99408.1 hypothetical protein P174DRAFT_437864 [Aspergillus novofumigatus IBT 16806]
MYGSFQKALFKLPFSPSLLGRVFAAEFKARPMHSGESTISSNPGQGYWHGAGRLHASGHHRVRISNWYWEYEGLATQENVMPDLCVLRATRSNNCRNLDIGIN